MPYLAPVPDVGPPTETAVIVPIAEAEPVVRDYRDRLDPAAGWGIPAHVTILYPFAAPSAVDEQLIARLAAAVASVNAFDCHLTQTRWFGDQVLWLEPRPADAFGHLTTAVWEAFPGHPPYGGSHDDVIPHLTVAQRGPADLRTLRVTEQAMQPHLPIPARIGQALLIAGSMAPNSWRILHSLLLGGARGAARMKRPCRHRLAGRTRCRGGWTCGCRKTPTPPTSAPPSARIPLLTTCETHNQH